MRDRRRRRFLARGFTALAAGGGVAAGLAIERGHLRQIARDRDYARLSGAPRGLQRSVRSADGTRLQARVFGADDAPTLVLAHSGHLLFGEAARWLRHPVAGRMLLGSRAPAPRFSSPFMQAALRYGAFGPSATVGQVAFYERMLIACPADVRAACGVAMSAMDLHEAAARLTVPTLVVAGAHDRLTPPAHARRIVAALPHPAGLVILPDTGHMSPLERPTECSDALYELVAECGRPRDTPRAQADGPAALAE